MQAKLLNGTINALLIEDNPDDAEFLSQQLQRVKGKNIALQCCQLLSTGLSRLALGGVDIVFLDLSLPDSSGIETLQRVHKLTPQLPIVVLTGTDDDDLAIKALAFGAQDYLVKGQIDASSLGRSINFAIGRQSSYASLQWSEAVVQGSNDAIIGKSMENIILSWNSGAERMFGYQSSEVIGKSMDILLLPDLPNDSTLNAEHNAEQLKRDETVAAYEAKRRRKDGKIIEVFLSASPICDLNGAISGVSVIVRDITQQKFTEQMLRESDERLKLALSASNIGLWDWDLGEDKVRWDDQMYVLFGQASQHFVPSFDTFMECVHPDDRQHVSDTVKSSLSAGVEFDFDFRIFWYDGTLRHLEAKGETFCDAQSQPIRMTGVCFDTTDRTIAENALKDSDQRLRLALEAAKMGVWDWNLVSDQVWRSRRHDEIFGYESMLPEWTYQMFLAHVVPEDRPHVEETITLGLTRGDFSLECQIVQAREKSVRWISSRGEAHKDENGKVIRIIGTITDITESKQLEHAARLVRKRREQIAQAIVQHAPIGIAILDKELEVTNINAAFASMLHCDQTQLVCRPLASALPEQCLPLLKEFVAGGKHIQVSRFPVAIQNQHAPIERYWDLSLWPVSNDKGEMIEAVLLSIDCTQTVMVEQQRDDFVASVAHDIKNPLIGAERVFDLLCDQSIKTSPENHARMLAALREGNQNLLSLVQNLVDVYRFEKLEYPCHFETTDLKTIVSSCVQQIADFAQSHDVSIENKVLDSSFIEADAIALRRVFMNLMHNAIKFNKQKGTVELSIDQQTDAVRMRVADTGGGISDSDQQRLFQRFSQGGAGKRYASGTGLGLYLSKQIVEAHHGRITCESKLGSGTAFIITLPVKQASNSD